MFGIIDTIVQTATIIIQVILTGHIAKRFGIGVLLTSVPLIMAGGFLWLAFAPTVTLREIDVDQAEKVLGYAPSAKGENLQGRCLVAPIKIGGKLSSLQLIDGAGRKHFLANGAIGGGYWAAQSLPNGDDADLVLLIGEGVGTTLTARRAKSSALGIAAMMNSNIPAVARQMRERFPLADIVILADIDKKSGEPDKYAVEAAGAVGGRLAVPRFVDGPGPDRKDVNDLARVHGADAVRDAIEAAEVSSAPAACMGDNSAGDWPDLVPLHGEELPALSASTFGGWLGDYASALAQATEVPLELSAAMTLGVASATAARRLRLLVKTDYFEPLNLWLLPTLAPGNRKSAVERSAASPLREWEQEQAVAMKAEIEEAASAEKVATARGKELRAEAAKTKDDAKARELASKALCEPSGRFIRPHQFQMLARPLRSALRATRIARCLRSIEP